MGSHDPAKSVTYYDVADLCQDHEALSLLCEQIMDFTLGDANLTLIDPARVLDELESAIDEARKNNGLSASKQALAELERLQGRLRDIHRQSGRTGTKVYINFEN